MMPLVSDWQPFGLTGMRAGLVGSPKYATLAVAWTARGLERGDEGLGFVRRGAGDAPLAGGAGLQHNADLGLGAIVERDSVERVERASGGAERVGEAGRIGIVGDGGADDGGGGGGLGE